MNKSINMASMLMVLFSSVVILNCMVVGQPIKKIVIISGTRLNELCNPDTLHKANELHNVKKQIVYAVNESGGYVCKNNNSSPDQIKLSITVLPRNTFNGIKPIKLNNVNALNCSKHYNSSSYWYYRSTKNSEIVEIAHGFNVNLNAYRIQKLAIQSGTACKLSILNNTPGYYLEYSLPNRVRYLINYDRSLTDDTDTAFANVNYLTILLVSITITIAFTLCCWCIICKCCCNNG